MICYTCSDITLLKLAIKNNRGRQTLGSKTNCENVKEKIKNKGVICKAIKADKIKWEKHAKSDLHKFCKPRYLVKTKCDNDSNSFYGLKNLEYDFSFHYSKGI